MHEAYVRITEVDSRKLQALIEGALLGSRRDTGNLEQLERHLIEAEVVPAARIGPEVVTMNSEVRVTDLDTGETFSFRVVYPRAADAAAGSISVLAPLGMAVLYQPEREGKDLSAEGAQRKDERAS